MTIRTCYLGSVQEDNEIGECLCLGDESVESIRTLVEMRGREE